MKFILLIAAVLVLSPLSAFSAEKHLNLNADDIEQLRAQTGAGDLHIHGEDVEEIQLKAIIPDELSAEDYQLTLTQKGQQAVLIAKITNRTYHRGGIDLEVIVPKTINLDINDSSGDMCVRTIVGDVKIQDSSGDIGLYTVAGDVDITDSSGDVEVNTISGDVSIADSSGGIEVVTVSGDLSIEDGSGDIEIDTVTSPISIDDGSGDIDITNADEVRINSDGSGDRRFNNVNKVSQPDER